MERSFIMEMKYYLAIEIKPNNYFPINLADLNIANNFNTTKLAELDNFTSKFTKEEIINSIRNANLLDIKNNMPLIIIYNEKGAMRKAPVLTKDNNFDMWDYLQSNFSDKNFTNKVYNFLSNKIDEYTLANIKNAKTKEEFIYVINEMPYNIERKLYFYLYEN